MQVNQARRREWSRAGLAILGIAVVMAAVELAMGRVLICTCGAVDLWHGEVNSAGNSQHLSDWYTPSHIVHGLLFYAAARWLLPGKGLPLRTVLAALVEAAWEVVENTPAVIGRYRDATIALGYTGDSVVNSLADLVAMLLGFALAARLPVWASVLLVLALELAALLAIRDNLTLNVLMLLWPSEAIRNWQAG
ncbi:DUF2585 domain-containing protein [Roseomonas sp. ACRSG]|nr:DUF2585 domain-containing protein [Roseomonas sp. ACRSG]